MTSLFSCNITPPESDPSANLSNLDEFFSNRFIHEAKATSIINTGLTLSDKTDKYENKCITIDANYNEELGKTSFGLFLQNGSEIGSDKITIFQKLYFELVFLDTMFYMKYFDKL